MIIIGLYTIFAVYFLLDAYHTELLLKAGAIELNPMLAWGIDQWGIGFVWGVKVFWLVFLAISLSLYRRDEDESI